MTMFRSELWCIELKGMDYPSSSVYHARVRALTFVVDFLVYGLMVALNGSTLIFEKVRFRPRAITILLLITSSFDNFCGSKSRLDGAFGNKTYRLVVWGLDYFFLLLSSADKNIQP